MNFERQLAWPCRDCSVRGSSFCSTLIDQTPSSESNQISQVFLSASQQEVIQHNGHNGSDYFSGPLVLCKGWAYRFYRFADGRRQILSVLIPGDLFSAFALLDPQSEFSVQAVTDIKVCQLGKDGLKKELAAKPGICDAFGKLCAAEIDEVTLTTIDLNQSNKTTRVLGFVQRLIKRLSARGIVILADVYPFPLSHTDIADATGLTPDDVSRTINDLRKDRIIDMSDDVLTVLDPKKFEKSAMATSRK